MSMTLNSHTPVEASSEHPGYSGFVIWLSRLLCMVALSISGYLSWTALNASEVYGCGGDVLDCGHVLTSTWSKWFGIPVSLPAFGLYASLLAVLLYVRRDTPSQLLPPIWGVLRLGSALAALAALWFIGLQVAVIQHFCTYCLAAHACGLLLSAIIWWHAPATSLRGTLTLVSLAVFGLGILATGQLLSPASQTFIVEHFDDVDADNVLPGIDGEPGTEEDLFAAPDDLSAAPEVFSPPAVFSPPGTADSVESSEEVAVEDPRAEPSASNGDGDKAVENAPQGTDTGLDQRPQVAASLLLFFSPSSGSLIQYLRGPYASGGTDLLPEEGAAAGDIQEDDTAGAEGTEAETGIETETEPAAVEPPLEPRIVSAAGGRFRLNAAQWPIIGKPTAKYIFVEMFDYTCPHCRNTHRTIREAMRQYGDDLAVITLAVPLNPACNSAASGGSQHADACELARISVAVWRVNPERFIEFHHWLFEGNRNRTAAEARRHAEQLVGKEALLKELSQKTASEYISRHVELYRKVGAGSVPKLLFPRSSMTGDVASYSALKQMIEREFSGR